MGLGRVFIDGSPSHEGWSPNEQVLVEHGSWQLPPTNVSKSRHIPRIDSACSCFQIVSFFFQTVVWVLLLTLTSNVFPNYPPCIRRAGGS
jgi:hypothetical protein